MPDDVKRPYNSPRRREQAAATRLAILEAAEPLFEANGYARTTMGDISKGAGVALKTVYIAFETKSGVLRALWNLRLRGDQADAPVATREWYQRMLEEPDAERQLRLNARNARMVKTRVGRLLGVIRAAAPADADVAALWDRIQTDFYENQHAIVERLHASGALKPGLDVRGVTDVVWTLNHPVVWLLLFGERGWAPQRFERWLGDALCSQLLARPGAERDAT